MFRGAAVLPQIAVLAVAEDRMTEVGQMTAQLVLAAGFDDVWMRALSQFGWRGLLPLNERVEFADDSGQDEENKVNPGR